MNKYVYIGTNPGKNENRKYFADATRWAYVRLGCLVMMMQGTTNQERYFKPEREYGDAFTDTGLYVLADDDCIPGDVSMFDEAYRVMSNYRDVGMIGFGAKNIPHAYVSGIDKKGHKEVSEIGGIRVVRAGIIEETDLTEGLEDRDFCAQFLNKGYKIYALDYPFHHLGEGYTMR